MSLIDTIADLFREAGGLTLFKLSFMCMLAVKAQVSLGADWPLPLLPF